MVWRALALLLVLTASASAQPVSETRVDTPPETPPTEPAPPTEAAPQVDVPPEVAPPPEPAVQPKADLSVLDDDERALFKKGRYNDGEVIGGTFLAVFPGFGLGHVLQGRWLERGWIFTTSQIAGLFAISYGHDRAVDECTEGVRCTSTGVKIYVTGWILFAGGWIVGALDAYIAPTRHNNKLRDIHRRAYHSARVIPYVTPSSDRNGALAGVSLTF